MSRLIQASAVAIGGRGMLILGPPGSGKSSLALALIDRGAQLIGDDGVSVAEQGGILVAAPPPRITGLIEVRNIGLLSRPVSEPVALALALRLDPGAPRMPDQAETTVFEGIELPCIALWPDSPVLALRAEAALERWGLSIASQQGHIDGAHERS